MTAPVRLAGDATGDGSVGIRDATLLGRAWRSSAGDGDYDAAVDFDGDGDVDVFDAVALGRNWGATTLPR